MDSQIRMALLEIVSNSNEELLQLYPNSIAIIYRVNDTPGSLVIGLAEALMLIKELYDIVEETKANNTIQHGYMTPDGYMYNYGMHRLNKNIEEKEAQLKSIQKKIELLSECVTKADLAGLARKHIQDLLIAEHAKENKLSPKELRRFKQKLNKAKLKDNPPRKRFKTRPKKGK